MLVIGLETATSVPGARLRPISTLDLSDALSRLASDLISRDWPLTLTSRTTPGRAPEASWSPMTEAGQVLGRYRLVERLGRGCQGEVWRAATLAPEAQEVALKVLQRDLARDPRRMAQFRREADRGMRLAGPALLPTLEYGEAEGFFYMAMPLVDGCSLRDIIAWRNGREPVGTPLRLPRLAFAADDEYLRGVTKVLERVARALAGVHAAHVAHRDIKPANILLDRGRDAGFLCDFGLGRDLDVATAEQLRDGAGTPLYMAPERLLRRPADEIRCDIYALGATLFEAVTLVPPLQVPEGLSWPSWTTYLATTRPRRPRTLRDEIPPALEAIILKAMARRPGRRYPTAASLADDLDRFLAGMPVLAADPFTPPGPDPSRLVGDPMKSRGSPERRRSRLTGASRDLG
ncbi:MAG: serine/threonine protein kinase [Planctomycetaceae bacterium]|nr:serine/threonine protein kinase [Planctomycetaceae bacterium]